MGPHKHIARIVGALFIITMIIGMIDAYGIAPILAAPLDGIIINQHRIIMGAFCIFFMSIGITGIAILLFPVLKTHNETIAVMYVSFRTIECVLLLTGSVVYLILIPLSREYSSAGNPAASHYLTLASMAIQARYAAYQIAMMVLGIGSLFLCHLLYTTRLIPRWISIIGFISYILLFTSALLDIADIIDTVHGAGVIMYAPGALFELILLPAWLIVKGFNQPAIDGASAVAVAP